jgi:hypothetical protein
MAILYCFWVLRLGSEAGCFAAVRDGTSGRFDHLPEVGGVGYYRQNTVVRIYYFIDLSENHYKASS